MVVAAGAIFLAGCGSDDDEGSSGSTDTAAVEAAQAELDKLYEGTHSEPPTDAPAPAEGKEIWVMSPGNASEAAKINADAVVEAADKLGWSSNVIDAKFDPTLMLAGIRDAVGAGADGIYIYSFDCAPIRSGLEEAKAAGIPVVVDEGFDCSDVEEGAPSLYTWVTRFEDGLTFPQYIKKLGEAQAIWTIAKTEGEAKILSFRQSDLRVTADWADAFENYIRENCPGCEIVETINFTGRDYGPPLQQKASQALLKHPDVTVVYGNQDAGVANGIAAAVRESGRDLLLVGGEGLSANLDYIRDGLQSMAEGYDPGWPGYAAVDAFVRIFAGEEPSEKTGLGVRIIDEEHNLPAEGAFDTGVDYKQIYEEAWGVE